MPQPLLSAPYTTIHYRDTLLVLDQQGWIGQRQTGLFRRDTRYLCSYQLTINGSAPRFLNSSQPYYFAATFYYTNPDIGSKPQHIAENSLLLKVSRVVRDGVHEDLELTNYCGRRVDLALSISLWADFADIFQVRGFERLMPRTPQQEWQEAQGKLCFRYRQGDFNPRLYFQIRDCSNPSCAGPPTRSAQGLTFEIQLPQGSSWHSCIDIHFEGTRPPGHIAVDDLPILAHELTQWQADTTRLETSVESLARVYQRAVIDLGSLRLENCDNSWFPAAGIPWHAAVLGRNAVVTAWQALMVHYPLAVAVLERLAELQGKKTDNWTEEEPGKLPHELRHGELAALGIIPHSPYYGGVDASLLYVILLHELFCFTADPALLARFYAPAAACLEWAANYGDVDGDGFIEYRPRSRKGYRNQGWKDSFDAVVYPQGEVVAPPIALCEVQGYYYDALRRMAQVAEVLGHPEESVAYRRRAAVLAEHFNNVFWLEQEGTYAYGLDSRKQAIATIASNAGHLLWTGIVPAFRAIRLARRLLAGDMFSGWGIRTLSALNPAFDPGSFQRGSVWPHDNSIIAAGLKGYGFWQEANRVASGIIAAAGYYEQHSLPELFAGFERRIGQPPVPHAEANMPQAWAAGSVFSLLRAMLGLEPDPMRHRLVLTPTLPDWLPDLTLRNLKLFGYELDLRFVGPGPTTAVEVLRGENGVEIEVRRPAAPHSPILPSG